MSTYLGYDVFIAEPIPQNVTEHIPNGDRRMWSPLSTTLIQGSNDAVLVDPPFTREQACAVGDWVQASNKNVTHVFATHGHGDHWFTAGMLADRFGAQIIATRGTIEQMYPNVGCGKTCGTSSSRAKSPRPTSPPSPGEQSHRAGRPPTPRCRSRPHRHRCDSCAARAGPGPRRRRGRRTTACTSTWPNRLTVGVTIGVRLSTSSKPSTRGSWRGTRTKISTTTPRARCPSPRDYLHGADELLSQHTTELGFFNAMLERYPDPLNPGALWMGVYRPVPTHPSGR
jgi:hypothetical protein